MPKKTYKKRKQCVDKPKRKQKQNQKNKSKISGIDGKQRKKKKGLCVFSFLVCVFIFSVCFFEICLTVNYYRSQVGFKMTHRNIIPQRTRSSNIGYRNWKRNKISKAAMSAKMSNLAALSAAKRKSQKQKMDANCIDIEMNENKSTEMIEKDQKSDSSVAKRNGTTANNSDIDIVHDNDNDIDNTQNTDTEQQTSEEMDSSKDRNGSNDAETTEFDGSASETDSEMVDYLQVVKQESRDRNLSFANINGLDIDTEMKNSVDFGILFDLNSFQQLAMKHILCPKCRKENSFAMDCINITNRGNYSLFCSNCNQITLKIQNQTVVQISDAKRGVPNVMNCGAIIAALRGITYKNYEAIIKSMSLHPVGSTVYYRYINNELYFAVRDKFYILRDELITTTIRPAYAAIFNFFEDIIPLACACDTRWQKRTKNYDSLDGTTWMTDVLTGHILALCNMHRQTPANSRDSENEELFEECSG